MKLRLPINGLSSNTLILLVSLFLVAACNQAFFTHTLKIYPLESGKTVYLASLTVSFFAVNALLLSLISFGRATKPVLIIFLLLASLAAYFMDSYGVVLSDEMLRNAVQTNPTEARDLITSKLFAYLFFLGVLPASIIAKIPLRWRGWRRELAFRLGLIAGLGIVIIALVMASSSFYASFLREHKSLRSYANPAYFTYSALRYADQTFSTQSAQTLTILGADARKAGTDTHRHLTVLVVGETARADRFSINGYERETTPQLKAAQVMNFSNYWACGTSTAVSVPCMFSMAGMNDFDLKTAASRENLLDVLQHAGVNVLWLDNNSDSKGVAARSTYEEFKSPPTNPLCDEECRDEGMLPRLQAFVDSHPTGDLFVVLHQMGNHGPAYFKRYPASFAKFTPVCQSNDLSQCTREEISNAYDNAILYTDHFLGKTIEQLKRNDKNFQTALFYLSDHGESLGENGIYLHGLPRAIAPDNQLHVPAIIWLGSGFNNVDRTALHKKSGDHFTHDNVVHTVLGLMGIETKLYRPKLDILNGTRQAK
ncbi:MAG: phosphoethanolamine transferase [Betaproteobacteria bacterium HGW-Betaproteobacteria-10]|nr:MAG: phosphoethanolamine transferase [Betaproteobacteria bacterium HGW-Betaproteobacteria-10]